MVKIVQHELPYYEVVGLLARYIKVMKTDFSFFVVVF